MTYLIKLDENYQISDNNHVLIVKIENSNMVSNVVFFGAHTDLNDQGELYLTLDEGSKEAHVMVYTHASEGLLGGYQSLADTVLAEDQGTSFSIVNGGESLFTLGFEIVN